MVYGVLTFALLIFLLVPTPIPLRIFFLCAVFILLAVYTDSKIAEDCFDRFDHQWIKDIRNLSQYHTKELVVSWSFQTSRRKNARLLRPGSASIDGNHPQCLLKGMRNLLSFDEYSSIQELKDS